MTQAQSSEGALSTRPDLHQFGWRDCGAKAVPSLLLRKLSLLPRRLRTNRKRPEGRFRDSNLWRRRADSNRRSGVCRTNKSVPKPSTWSIMVVFESGQRRTSLPCNCLRQRRIDRLIVKILSDGQDSSAFSPSNPTSFCSISMTFGQRIVRSSSRIGPCGLAFLMSTLNTAFPTLERVARRFDWFHHPITRLDLDAALVVGRAPQRYKKLPQV
jgi:hypothetical protein